jgi:hypothetical protein
MRAMRRLHSARLSAALAAALLLPAGAAAYWTAIGSATGVAKASTLSGPGAPTARITGNGKLTLEWSAVTPPAGSASEVKYYLKRDGAAPGGSCPSSSASAKTEAELGGLTCTDEGASTEAEHKYAVTAVWRSWSTAGTEVAVFVPKLKFKIGAEHATLKAGEEDKLTIEAVEARSESTVVTGYTGEKTLKFEGASAIEGHTPTVTNKEAVAKAFLTEETIKFVSGVASSTTTGASGQAVTRLYRAEAAGIKAKEGSIESNSVSVTIEPKGAGLAALTLSPAALTPKAGEADNLTLEALDEYGNRETGYSGEKEVTFEANATQAPSGTKSYVTNKAGEQKTLSENPVVKLSFSSGKSEVEGGTRNGQLVLYDAVSTSVTAKLASKSASKTLTVSAGSFKSFNLEASVGEPTAGSEFSIKLRAWDEWHNVITSYARTAGKKINYEGAESSPTGTTPVYGSTEPTFSSGEVTVAGFKLYRAASTTLKAKEETSGNSGETTFTVKHGANKRLGVSGASPQTAGSSFTVTLKVQDEWGNATGGIASSGEKTVAFSGPASSPSKQAPSYPAKATFNSSGEATASVTLYDAQTAEIAAEDSTDGYGAGTKSTAIVINPAEATHWAWAHAEVTGGEISSATCLFTCETTNIGNNKLFKAHASVTDEWGNVVSNLSGTNRADVTRGGKGTITGNEKIEIPTSGRAESSTTFEYTSPASGEKKAELHLQTESSPHTLAEASANVPY